MALLVVYTVIVGLAASGLAGSLWSLVTGAPPSVALFEQRDWRLPVRIAFVVVYAPILILNFAWGLAQREMILALLLGVLSLVWCFLQGVFILTQVFGAN